jgi:hypothetical protein
MATQKFYQAEKTEKYAIVNSNGDLFNPKGETWESNEPVKLSKKSYLTWLMKRHVGHSTMNCEIKKLA